MAEAKIGIRGFTNHPWYQARQSFRDREPELLLRELELLRLTVPLLRELELLRLTVPLLRELELLRFTVPLLRELELLRFTVPLLRVVVVLPRFTVPELREGAVRRVTEPVDRVVVPVVRRTLLVPGLLLLVTPDLLSTVVVLVRVMPCGDVAPLTAVDRAPSRVTLEAVVPVAVMGDRVVRTRVVFCPVTL